MKKYILATFLSLGLLISPAFVAQAEAAGLSSAQINAIIGLLQSFGADQSVITNVQAALGGGTPPVVTSSVTGKLSPTGITTYSDATTNSADASVAADTGAFPRQDARYARHFDYTKIANDGSVLPATATLGTGAKDWACTRDNITGLTWEVKTTSGLRNQTHTYSWYKTNGTTDGKSLGVPSAGICATSGRCDTEKYVEDVNAVGLCGMKDWMMPTVGELQSIVDFGSFNPAIDTQYFPDTLTTSKNWWTGVPDSNSVGYNAWMISFVGGQTSGAAIAPYHIRLVRNSLTLQPYSAGQCKAGLNNSPNNPNSKYTISNNGTVTDKDTNLMWKRCSEGQSWDTINNTCKDNSILENWSEALTSSVNDRTGGYSDWRLPNIKELNSIVEFCTDAPAINSSIFPAMLFRGAYWSSTPSRDIYQNTLWSWALEFQNGGYLNVNRTSTQYVRFVRNVTASSSSIPPVATATPTATFLINGQISATNVDPLVSRTWSWSSTSGSSYAASAVISGCETASQNGTVPNWMPWNGGYGTVTAGTAANGSTGMVPGTVKYGCTIVATYRVTSYTGQSATAQATVTFRHRSGS